MDTFCNTPKQPSSEQCQQQSQHEMAKSMKPRPIIIYQVRDYDIIYNYLNTKLERKYRITLLNSGDLKLSVHSAEHYRTASQMLYEA
jgi:hypothetical protein